MKLLPGSSASLLVSARERFSHEARDRELIVELTNRGRSFVEITTMYYRLPRERYPGSLEVPLTGPLAAEASLPRSVGAGESVCWCISMRSVQKQVYKVAVAEAEMPGYGRLEMVVYRLLPIALQKILRPLVERPLTVVLRDSRGKRYKAKKVQREPRW